MSGKDTSEDRNVPEGAVGNVPQAPEEHEEEQREAEVQEFEHRDLETGSRDSGHDSPLEFATGGSRDSGHESPLEGAVGGCELKSGDIPMTSQERSRIKPEKEGLFIKFFSQEYDQADEPILTRQRHNAERQTPGDPLDPTGQFEVGLNSEKHFQNSIPIERNPIIGMENDQSHSSIPIMEDPEIGSAENILLDYEFRPPSDDSRRGLSPGSSFMSTSSHPQTASTDYMQTSPLHYSASDEEKPAEAEVEQEQPTRQRRFGVVAHPMLVRSKSAHTESSNVSHIARDEYHKRKVSEAMSVCSEPLPMRKISKDSSAGSSGQMSVESDTAYPELSHSSESEPSLPMPDLDPDVMENLDALTVSAMDSTEQNTEQAEESVSEQDTTQSGNHEAESSQEPPNA